MAIATQYTQTVIYDVDDNESTISHIAGAVIGAGIIWWCAKTTARVVLPEAQQRYAGMLGLAVLAIGAFKIAAKLRETP